MRKLFLKAVLILSTIAFIISYYDNYKKQKQMEYEQSLPPKPAWDTATSPTYQHLKEVERKLEERMQNNKRQQKSKQMADSLTEEQRQQLQWIEDQVESEIENKMD